MNTILDNLSKIGIVPVIKLDDAKDAVPLAKALCAGGLPAAEITFRTAAAAEAIRAIRKEVPDMITGAGTVLTTEQADAAIEAGAQFIVSPGLNPEVVSHCIKKGILMLPGCATPSDMEKAISLGLDTVKFFPAEPSGGVKMLKALSGPYTQLKFMPTGGVKPSNLEEYLAFDKIVACGGTWMVPDELIKNGDFKEIEALTKQAVVSMLGVQLLHVGINGKDNEDASSVAGAFNKLFGLATVETEVSYFSGDLIEIMKKPMRGDHGHIGFKVNNLERAVRYLEYFGCTFNQSTAKYDEKGRLIFIYLEGQIGGFALHLNQK